VTGAVGCVARASYRSFSVISGVTSEAALIDLAIWGSVKGKSHVLKINNGLN
jgi:hypothetical protein